MPARKLEKYLARQFEQHVLTNSVEREQKYRIAKVDPVRSRLLSLGAEAHASGFERNEMFDFEGRLRVKGQKLRLRRHGTKFAMLTLKGPRLAGRQKTRMEVETPVDYEATKRILELVGFRIKETYSKIREEYRLDGCAVCLDHIPNAGWFVEIEGSAMKIRSIARRLGLQPADREHRSYRRLIRDAAIASASMTAATGVKGRLAA
jgi:adenylate cyclase class 2